MIVSGNIEVPRANACAFCDYLSGTRPYTILDRDDLSATLVTREQRGVSHVLIVPVRHCETILDLTTHEAHALILRIISASRAIDEADARPGIAVWQNNGIPADQTIPHVHFHVAGTLPGGGTNHGQVCELSISETELIARRLRPFLGKGPHG